MPDGAVTSAESATGGRLGAPLRRGSPVTDAALLGPGLLTGAPRDRSAVPLRVADPAVLRVLRPGDRVDVVLARGDDAGAAGPARTVARSVTVLWTSSTSTGAAPAAGMWPAAGEDSPVAVVAVPHPVAAELAASAGSTRAVSLVIVGPGR